MTDLIEPTRQKLSDDLASHCPPVHDLIDWRLPVIFGNLDSQLGAVLYHYVQKESDTQRGKRTWSLHQMGLTPRISCKYKPGAWLLSE